MGLRVVFAISLEKVKEGAAMIRILDVLLVGCLAGMPAMAADVTGKWTFESRDGVQMGGRTVNFRPAEIVTIELKADGNLLTGSVTSPRTGARNIPSVRRISHGHVDGNHLSFDVATELAGTPLITRYEGVLDGDIIYLTIKTGGGVSNPPPTIEAHRYQTTQENPAVGPTAKASPLGVSSQNSGPKLAILDDARMQRLAVETKLDLFLLKFNPSLFDDHGIMRYFIVLNNCAAPRDALEIESAFNSEFDYPKMASFYRAKAPEILAGVPVTLRIQVSVFPNLTNNRTLPSIAAVLGDYDVARKAFPFVNGYNSRLRETIGLDSISPGPDRANDCVKASRQLPSGLGLQTSKYVITFKQFAFTELPIDEAAAEAYVRRGGVPAGGRREVSLILDLELKPEAPQSVDHAGTMGKTWNFAAEIKKITVVDKSHWPVGVLYP